MKTDKASMDAMIVALAKSSKDYHELLTSSAILCVLHGIEHGCASYANKALDALQNSAGDKKNALRLNPLRAWFISDVSPFTVIEREVTNETTGKSKIVKELALDKKKAAKLRKSYEANKLGFIGALRAKPWYETSKEVTEWKGFNFNEEMAKLIARANKEAERHKDDPKLDLGAIEQVRQAFHAGLATETVH